MALNRLVGRIGAALVALALGLGSAPAAAGLRQTYSGALEAMSAERWEEAERLFRAALELRSTEARRLTFRGIHEPYLPHYYLGAVLAQRGDCAGALLEWRRSREQGVIAAVGLGGELDRRDSACRRTLERLAELLGEAETLLAEAEAKADQLADPGRAHLLELGFESGFGTLGRRLTAARDATAETRIQIERARDDEDLELGADALERARETVRRLDEALGDLERIDGELIAARAAKRERIEEVRALARRVDGVLRSRSPLPPALRGRRQQLESLLTIAKALPETATLDQIAGLEQRLLSFDRQLRRSESPPPGTLRSGAIAFLRADYRAVMERLEEIPYGNGKARAHCLLLRSAAAFALHVAGGETDAEFLERARDDAVAARANVPDLVPAASAFSPRFLRFFEAVAGPDPEAQGG